MKKTFAAGAILLASLGAAHAQGYDKSGSVSMEFAGKASAFHTLTYTYDTAAQSTASVGDLDLPGMKGAQMLLITGAQNADSTGSSLHLALGFKNHPSDGEKVALVDQPDVTFYEGKQEPPYWASVPGATTIRFTRYEFDGKAGHASGTFSTRLCQVKEWDAEPDPKLCHEVSGAFDTPLLKAL